MKRTSPIRMALATLLVAIIACIVASSRAAATNCTYTVSISNSPGLSCLTDFPMSVTTIWGGGAASNLTTHPAVGNYTQPQPNAAAGLPITAVTVNGFTVGASPTGVVIPSSCPGRQLHIRVVLPGPTGCGWIYITLI